MTGHLSSSQVSLLLGMALVVFGGLVVLVVILHRAFAKGRQEEALKAKSPREIDQAAFAMATMQGVITTLKRQQKELEEQKREAERQAEESSRLNQIITREVPTGVMVFDKEGFLVMANPAARALLGIDSWSRRRYSEVLGAESKLVARIRKSLESGETVPWQSLEVRTSQGVSETLKVFLSPFSKSDAGADGIVCLLSKS